MPDIKDNDLELDADMLENVTGGVLTAGGMQDIICVIRLFLKDMGRNVTVEDFINDTKLDDPQVIEFVKFIWKRTYLEVFPQNM